jgi:hypothetical protein
VLDGERAAAMARLAAAWTAAREAGFAQAMDVLAASLARIASKRVVMDEAGLGDRLRQLGGLLRGSAPEGDPGAAARRRLAGVLEDEVRASTTRLLDLHGLRGSAGGAALEQILARVAGQEQQHRRLPEGRAAVLGGALTGALTGLKADLASGGLTLGGGLLAGGILGALGAAGLARGLNVMRGTGRSWAAWGDAAMDAITEAALLRYLAVVHFGRGRGDWVEGEAPPHWPAAVRGALQAQQDALAALWHGRSERADAGVDEAERLAGALRPLLERVARTTLVSLYPAPDSDNPRA